MANKIRYITSDGNIEQPDFIKLIKRVNDNKDKDFIKRFFDTESIDYNGIPATHLLSYAIADNGAIVYPVVQNINGKLQIPENPRESAIQRGDFIKMSKDDADWFTKNYKKYFPAFLRFK